jgi:flagellar motor switch protein FliG
MQKQLMNLRIKVYLFSLINTQQYNTNCFTDENEATTSFLMQLSSWDKEELDEKLANRVQVSKRAVAKVIQAFDRLMQRNEKITMALKGELEGGKF